ncbi:hypothetical protein CEK26_007994 [Fusarium fujikuroi]|nr:hypothetical protein CEK26_007994 [Fusarium fujikuroi]
MLPQKPFLSSPKTTLPPNLNS